MKHRAIYLYVFAALTALALLTACGGGTETATTEEPAPAAEPQAAPAEPELRWEAGGLTVYAMTDSPTFPGASLALENVEEGQELPSGPVAFDFTVDGYTLGEQTSDAADKGIANSAKGQHIHLILNNGPYSAHYEADFEKELEDGHYVALAFLSRSYHESLKNPEAAVVRQFTVGDAGEYEAVDLSAPHLFYSRPKGSYTGADTEKLMLDFYLFNTDLATDGNKVRATINGNEFVLPKWVPYLIEGLPMGEVTIQLELIDADGNVIPGPFNSVERTVTLEPAADEAG
jgi:hypothetical protein